MKQVLLKNKSYLKGVASVSLNPTLYRSNSKVELKQAFLGQQLYFWGFISLLLITFLSLAMSVPILVSIPLIVLICLSSLLPLTIESLFHKYNIK